MDLSTGSDSQKAPANRAERTRSLFYFIVAVVIIGSSGVAMWMRYAAASVSPLSPGSNSNVVATGIRSPVLHKLDPQFTDVNGDLVADAPTDPAKLIDPEKLYFCFIAADDAETNKQAWQNFCSYLSTAIGKPVEYLPLTTTKEEWAAMAAGKLQLAAFNTGSVPYAVNHCGFHPVCALPSGERGALIHTDIIVPSDSPIERPSDLKGHELTLTSPDSNSGYKAPLVLLRSDFGLQGALDFTLRYSFSHEASIAGIASHRYEAAAVASDMLGREIAAGVISPGQFRTIYESESFPTAALGYVYNLKPELAEKIHDALLKYDWAGTPLEKALSSTKQTRFVRVNYKNDWSLIRRIDDETTSPDQ